MQPSKSAFARAQDFPQHALGKFAPSRTDKAERLDDLTRAMTIDLSESLDPQPDPTIERLGEFGRSRSA